MKISGTVRFHTHEFQSLVFDYILNTTVTNSFVFGAVLKQNSAILHEASSRNGANGCPNDI